MTAQRSPDRPGLRIAYLHQYYQSRSTWGGTRSYEFGRRLVERGHEVHVITADRTPDRARGSWRVTVDDGIHVHWLGVPYSNSMSYPRRMVSFLRFAASAGPRAARVRPDVVLASSTPLTIAVPGLVASWLSHARFVFEVRDLWPEVPIEMGILRNPLAKAAARRLADAAYRRAGAVITLSPGMAAGVVARGAPADRVVVVPNACDLDLFGARPKDVAAFRAARPWLGDRPLLVYAGTFGTVNGVDYLVRLAAEVRRSRPEVRFLLIGSGVQQPAVAGLARALGVLDETLFIEDPVPRSSLPTVLGAATITSSVVIPVRALEHNSANKFFDSLAAGRPIAINHGGWQADLLESAGAGLVLDPDDIVAAARVLADRITDPDWLAGARRQALTLAGERFDRDLLFEPFAAAVTGGPVRDLPPDLTADDTGTRTGHGRD